MKFFIDTANIEEIKELLDTGMIDGITTNPSLVSKTKRPFLQLIEEISQLVGGPVSAEIVAKDYETMLLEGRKLGAIASNIIIKVPLTMEGLKACRKLREEGFMVNVTLCFSASQAILAAKADATFISPFIGRLDDTSRLGTGLELISDICTIYHKYPEFKTQILVASVRHPNQIIQVAKLGAHAVTLPPAILRHTFTHPLTEIGLQLFEKDWKTTGQSILKS